MTDRASGQETQRVNWSPHGADMQEGSVLCVCVPNLSRYLNLFKNYKWGIKILKFCHMTHATPTQGSNNNKCQYSCACDSMFYPLTMCTLQIVLRIMIINFPVQSFFSMLYNKPIKIGLFLRKNSETERRRFSDALWEQQQQQPQAPKWSKNRIMGSHWKRTKGKVS